MQSKGERLRERQAPLPLPPPLAPTLSVVAAAVNCSVLSSTAAIKLEITVIAMDMFDTDYK